MKRLGIILQRQESRKKTIYKVSTSAINYETTKVTGLSVAASIPGGGWAVGAAASTALQKFADVFSKHIAKNHANKALTKLRAFYTEEEKKTLDENGLIEEAIQDVPFAHIL